MLAKVLSLYGNNNFVRLSKLLTHFSPMSHFYTPWKRQKTYSFLKFAGGIEIWHCTKNGLKLCKVILRTVLVCASF